MARDGGAILLYAQFVDTAGNELYLSDQAFRIGSLGTPRDTNAVIASWGPLRAMLGQGGQNQEAEVDLELLASEYITFLADTTRKKVIDYLRESHPYDKQVIIYSWNEADQTQAEIWRGKTLGIVGELMDQRGSIVVIRVTSRDSSLETTNISPVVIREDIVFPFPSAPTDSLGVMVPRCFNRQFAGIIDTATAPNDAVFLGYGTGGIPGVITSESVADWKADVEFKRDGSVYDSALSGTTNDPSAASSFWLYNADDNNFALIDAASFTASNNTTQTKLQLSLQPTVFYALRPSGIGANMASGFTATAYKLTDDDPTNYIESDGAGNHTWAINIPPLLVQNFRPTDLRLVVDIENASGGTRDIDYGIWNVADTGGADFLGGGKKQTQAAISATRTRYYTTSGNAYIASDFSDANMTGQGTIQNFEAGRFVGNDVSELPVDLQAYVTVTSASKNGVRLYGVGVIVKGKVWLDSLRRLLRAGEGSKTPVTGWPSMEELGRYRTAQYFLPSIAPAKQTILFAGFGHEDDLQYEGGAATDPMLRGAPIAQYCIKKFVPTETMNTTASTLGNWTDARTETLSEEKHLSPKFGPDPMTVQDVVREFNVRTPMRIFKDRGSWQCIYDEINPHSSRYYRSTSDPVRISAMRDVVGPVRVAYDGSDGIVNRVTVNYGGVFGSDRPMKSYTYENPFSTERFGNRQQVTINEPWIMPEAIGTVPESAKFLAKYAGRVNARPRLTLVVPLSQAFYDLRRGHVLELDTDFESVGFECPAYRVGLLDFMHFRGDATVSVNYANSAAPLFIPAASITSETYFASNRMFPSVSLYYTNTAAHTEVNNGWEYSSGVDSSDEPTWTALSGVTDSDGGDPDTAFTRTGPKTISWTRPGLHEWKKCERTFGSNKEGPYYWVRHKYSTATDTGAGNAITRVPATWYGIPFEVIEVNYRPGNEGRYPVIEAVLRETL